MRVLLVFLALALSGCLGQQCPECGCPTLEQPDCSNVSLAEPGCTSANITIIKVNQTCDQTAGGSNLTTEAPPEPEPDGIPFADNSYLLVLDDVSVPTSGKGSCGIFSIKHAGNLSVAGRFIACPGDSQYWVSPENDSYRIRVIEVAAGYTKDVKWAEVMIYG
jgi:hypothetical protein